MDHHALTRSIYHKQHSKVAADKTALTRFLAMFTAEYFGLGDDWFHGKKVLDAGCGNTGKLLISLANLGAGEIYGCDVGDEFIEPTRQVLADHGVDLAKVHLRPSSVTKLPYEGQTFDFVACHGVLLHLENMTQVDRG